MITLLETHQQGLRAYLLGIKKPTILSARMRVHHTEYQPLTENTK